MFKVRFHLQTGKHYKHWQIRDSAGDVQYYNPATSQLILYNCQLVSQQGAAKRVKRRGKKSVCGWIECDGFQVIPSEYEKTVDYLDRLWYNPILDTDWHMTNIVEPVTGMVFEQLMTKGNRVYDALCYGSLCQKS